MSSAGLAMDWLVPRFGVAEVVLSLIFWLVSGQEFTIWWLVGVL